MRVLSKLCNVLTLFIYRMKDWSEKVASGTSSIVWLAFRQQPHILLLATKRVFFFLCFLEWFFFINHHGNSKNSYLALRTSENQRDSP